MTTAVELELEPPARSESLAHVPAFDGLRGLAVLAVVAFHADLRWARGGFLGVDMFFVLSGFLITSLLRAEHARRAAISLPGFWSRRARRLLPALGFLCLVLLGYVALRPDHPALTNLRGDMFAALGYVANWRFVSQSDGYFTNFAPSPLRHLWSLAIEEQFYLLWPLVVLVVVRVKRPAVVVAVMAVVSATLMAVLVDPADPSAVYFGTHTHAHGLLLGAALAFVTIPRWRWLPIAGIVAALAMFGCMLVFDGSDLWVYRGGLFGFELLTVLVLAACVHPQATILGRALAWRPLCAVGLVSYGLYLWHWPVFVLVDEQLVGLGGTALLAVQLVITVGVTLLSYEALERPFRRGTLPGRHGVAFVPLVAGGLVAVLLLVTASLDSPIAAATRAAEHDRTLAVSHPGRRRVLLVGDSSAQTLAPGIEAALASRGIELVSGAAAGCALDWDVDLMAAEDGTWFPVQGDADCTWPRTWPRLLRRYRPDLVLINFGLWDASDHRIGARTFRYGSADWQQHMASTATRAVRVAGAEGARVGFVLSGAILAGVGPFNALLATVASRAQLPVFDLGPVADAHGTDYRWDGVHYTEAGARAVGVPVADWIVQVIPAAADRDQASRRVTQISSAGQRRDQR